MTDTEVGAGATLPDPASAPEPSVTVNTLDRPEVVHGPLSAPEPAAVHTMLPLRMVMLQLPNSASVAAPSSAPSKSKEICQVEGTSDSPR